MGLVYAQDKSLRDATCSLGELKRPFGYRIIVGAEMKYSIRPACDADYQYCYRLTKRNMLDLFCRHWGGWVPAEFRKGFNPDNVSMVIMHGRRVGYLSMKCDDQGIYIENLQLSPFLHGRGRGIGTEILEQLLKRYDKEVIRLTTFSDNRARRLYERLGFIITERRMGTLQMERLPCESNAIDAKSPVTD